MVASRGSWSAAPRSVEDEVKFLSLLAGDRGARRVYLARQAVVAGARARAELECRAANGNKHHAQPEAGLRRGRAAPGREQMTAAQEARRARKAADLEQKHRARRAWALKCMLRAFTAWRLAVVKFATVSTANVDMDADESPQPAGAAKRSAPLAIVDAYVVEAAASAASGDVELVWTSPSTGKRQCRTPDASPGSLPGEDAAP